MRVLPPAFLVILVLQGLLPAGLATPPDPPSPSQLSFADVPTWNIGSSWTFHVHTVTRDGPNASETWTNVTQTVAGVIEIPAGSSTLYLYNSTTTGNLTMSGSVWDATTGFTVDFAITSGDLSGYAWVERGDLAIARTNQTFSGNGTADVPVFGRRDLTAQGGLTAVARPHREEFDFPVAIGDTWRLTSVTNTTGNVRIVIDMAPLQDVVVDQPLTGEASTDATNWVNESAVVAVPAGSFEALHIESRDAAGIEEDLWYAPNASNYVRRESHEVAGPQRYVHSWMNLTDYSLASPPFDTSVTLSPRRVGPGIWFWVSTTTAPRAALRIIIPARNSTTFGVANNAGQDSHIVQAPYLDDKTPSPDDVGSHGVLIEANNGVATSYAAATVELDPPNLTVSALRWSPDIVINGELTVFTATVFADPPFGWPVNVTFLDEDVDLDDDGVLDAPMATFCARTPCGTSYAYMSDGWGNATLALRLEPPLLPGVVTVSAVVDAEDTYRELNETDNFLTRDVLVQAADLTLMNVSVAVGTTMYPFDDPAASGFVSPLIPIPGGARADLSARARNAGTANATRSTSLAFYNTTVLNGSGDPPFAQFSVSRLTPGELGAVANASWIAPAAAGTYFVNLTVDRGGALRETSENNNTFVLQFRVGTGTNQPDLIPAIVAVPAKASVGQSVNVAARAWNLGGGDASGFRVAFYNEAERAAPFAFFTVGPLTAGTNSSVLTSPWSSSVLGPHRIWIEVDYDDGVPEMDEANNTMSLTISVHDVPVTTLSIGSPKVVSDTTYVRPTTPLTFSSRDWTDEGPPTIWYRIDSGPWTTIGAGEPLYLPGGAHTVSYNSTDLLGGIEPTKVAAVFVDDLPPQTEAAVANGTGGKVVTLTAADLASGLNWTQYRIDNLTWTPYSGPIVITAPGVHYVEFRSEDLLGNREPVGAIVVTVEGSAAPTSGLNVKPLLALAFAALLLAAGFLSAPSAEPVRRRRWLLTVVLPPTLLEAFTGIASLFVAEMAVPGGSLGLPVDLVLLGIGLLIIWFSRHRALRAP